MRNRPKWKVIELITTLLEAREERQPLALNRGSNSGDWGGISHDRSSRFGQTDAASSERLLLRSLIDRATTAGERHNGVPPIETGWLY